MNAIPTAAAIEAHLRQQLDPSLLEVEDQSAAHAGHAGANCLGYGKAKKTKKTTKKGKRK